MKSLKELQQAVTQLTVSLNLAEDIGDAVQDKVGEDLSEVIARLEVFTDDNYTEEEQSVIFSRSGRLLEALKQHRAV